MVNTIQDYFHFLFVTVFKPKLWLLYLIRIKKWLKFHWKLVSVPFNLALLTSVIGLVSFTSKLRAIAELFLLHQTYICLAYRYTIYKIIYISVGHSVSHICFMLQQNWITWVSLNFSFFPCLSWALLGLTPSHPSDLSINIAYPCKPFLTLQTHCSPWHSSKL